MKKIFFILLMCLSVSAVATAQEEIKFPSGREKHDRKPQYFAHLTPKFSVRNDFVNELLRANPNEQLHIAVTQGFIFNGKVISKTKESNGLETIIVESEQKKGLLLSVSKYTKPDGSVEYMGVITSREISDIMMMEKDMITGNYQWIRKNISQMIVD
jgi:hypothetical protein